MSKFVWYAVRNGWWQHWSAAAGAAARGANPAGLTASRSADGAGVRRGVLPGSVQPAGESALIRSVPHTAAETHWGGLPRLPAVKILGRLRFKIWDSRAHLLYVMDMVLQNHPGPVLKITALLNHVLLRRRIGHAKMCRVKVKGDGISSKAGL